MNKIFTIILSSLLFMTSCNEEIKENWNADTLEISCDAFQNAGDGNLKLIIPTQYKNTVKLQVKSNSSWNVDIDNITYEDDIWVSSSVSEGNGNQDIELSVDDNQTNANRVCSVVIATTGNIPVKKTITVVQGNIDDMLTIGIDNQTIPAGITVSQNIDGSLDMVLESDFNSSFSIIVDGDVTPDVSVSFPEGMPDGWLIQDNVSPEPGRSAKSSSVSFTVTENQENVYREAFVTFTSSAGEVVNTKTLKVSQIGDENIVWSGYYFQGSNDNLDNAEIILPSTVVTDVKIGELKNSKADNIELPELEGKWFSLKINENNEILLTTTIENTSTNTENVFDLSLKSKLSNREFKIKLRQCMSGYGVILNKSLWSAELITDNVKVGGTVSAIEGLFDNSWSTDENNKLFVEFWDMTEPKVELIFYLGDAPHQYTHLGLLPRIEWVPQSPKNVRIDFSEDNNNWTNGEEQDGFKESELQDVTGNWLMNQYDCKLIRWFPISDTPITSRYVRVTVSGSYHDSNNISFDEFFISDRTGIE